MAFIPRFTLTGAPPLVRAYAIAASEDWDAYDVLALNGARALLENTAATNDCIGAALGSVGQVTAGQSDINELRSYLTTVTTGRHEPVAIFCPTTVFETDDYNSVGTAAGADVMERADMELVGGDDGNWGINNGTNATGSTPQLAIVDIEDTRGTYFVVPDIILISGVYQWYDAVFA